MEPLRDTVVTLGYGGATRRYFSDTRVLLEKCGAIMRHFSDAREPTGDKIRLRLILNVTHMYIRNVYTFKQNNKKSTVAFSCDV